MWMPSAIACEDCVVLTASHNRISAVAGVFAVVAAALFGSSWIDLGDDT